MNQHDFDLLPPHEKKSNEYNLINKGVSAVWMLSEMEKACSIRFDHRNYPQLKSYI